MGSVSTAGPHVRAVAALAALAAVLAAPAAASAQTFTWTQSTSGGSWQTTGNWSPTGGPPNASSTVAVFGNVATGANTVNLSAAVTVGELRFFDVNTNSLTAAYTIAAGQTITLNNGANPGVISVVGATRTNQTIAAALSATGPLAILNNGAPGMTTLTLSGAIGATSANTALSVGGTGNTVISGVIAANFGTLTKSGTGELTLSGANLYGGGTVISGGVLRVSNNNQLGAAAGTVTLDGGAIHFTANSFSSNRSFVIGPNGGTFLSSVAPNILTQQTATLTGVISGGAGSGSVTFDGGQYLELRANNTYTGPTIVQDAGLWLTNGGRLSGTSSITINGFTGGRIGVLDLLNGGAPNTDRVNDVASVTLNGGLLSYLAGTSSQTNEVMGDLTVKGYGLIYGNHQQTAAFGRLTFGAINRFDNFSTLYVGGPVNGPVNGSVQITFASGLSQQAGTGTQVPVIPWIGGDLGLNDGGNIRATGIAETLYTYNDDLGLIALNSSNYVQTGGGVAMQANRNISLSGNPAAVNAPLTILAMRVDPTAPSTGVTVTGSSTLTVANSAIANTLPLVFDGPTLSFGANTGYLWLGDNFTVQGSSQISGSNGLVVSSNWDDRFNGLRLRNTANTFTGGLYLNGTARADFNTSDAQLGAPGQVISFRGGQLHYSGTTSITLATSGVDRPLVMSAAGGGVINVEDLAVTLTVPGVVSGTEQLTKVGGGTLVLSNTANTYAGGTTLANGTLAVAGLGSLGAGPLTLGRTGGGPVTLRIDSSGTYAAAVNHASGSVTLNTNGSGVAATFSGVVSGNGTTLTKAGAGTLTLAGANTYTGNTAVNAGTLLANNGTGSGTGYGSVTVASGATLGGTGTVAGPVTVNSGGKLAPGGANGLGTLTVLGKTTLANGSTFQATIGSSASQFSQVVIGPGASIDIGSTAAFTATLGYTPQNSDKIFIVNNQNAVGGLTGTFNNVGQGQQYTFADGTKVTVSYTGDFATSAITGGNDLVLYNFQPVPEPATVLGIAALALGGGMAWRRRKGGAVEDAMA